MSTTTRAEAPTAEPAVRSGAAVPPPRDVDGGGRTALVPRPVCTSLDELLDGVERREPFRPAERRSDAVFEAVWRGGERFVLKHVHLDHDFMMRAAGDVGCLPVRAYGAGLCDLVPDLIDHAVVGAAAGLGRNGWGGALLMRDVTDDLVPPGGDPVPEAQHLRFLDHLAALSARTWGWDDRGDLMPRANRWSPFGHAAVEGERRLGWPEPVTRLVQEGWHRFADRAPGDVAAAVDALRHDAAPLVGAVAATPSCLLHGDWKASNLGTAADGRTVLIDWAYVGAGPVCHELAWYLALNRDRLPAGHDKERSVADLRAALGRRGVATDGWWERQLALCLLGAVVQFGWEKALGDDDELGWWCEQARSGIERL